MLTVNYVNNAQMLDLMNISYQGKEDVLSKLDSAVNDHGEVEHMDWCLSKIEELDAIKEPVTVNVLIQSVSMMKEIGEYDSRRPDALYTMVNGHHFLAFHDDFNLSMVAHEIQHFLDSMEGRLVTNQQTGVITWDGVEYERIDYLTMRLTEVEYINLPWERTAHEMELKYTSNEQRKTMIETALKEGAL